MILEVLLRYIHFLSIFTIFSSLVCEHLLLRNALSRKEITRLARIDAIYGIAALILLCAGLTLWLGGIGKPSIYYSKNWVFHTKIFLFVLVGLVSIYPTTFFIKNRKGHQEEMIKIPEVIFWCLRFELLLLFIIPLLAGLMAKGIGYFG